MGFGCLEIAEIITHLIGRKDVQEAVHYVDGRPEAMVALIGSHLDAPERALWQAEAASMPPGIMRQFAQAITDAVAHDLEFRFENTPPDDVLGFARERAVEIRFRYTETAIVASIAHTTRHPRWLPAVELPVTSERAQSTV